MKKAFLRVLTVLMLVCFGAAVFTACGDDNPPADTVYKLTYTANGGVGADITEEHKEGDAITLKGADAFTREGYTLTVWQDGDKSYAPGAAFTMPAKDVSLAAQWQENGEEPPVTDTYTVTVTGEHATATFDKDGPYKEGDVVKFSVKVDEGYDLVSVKNGSDTLTAGTDGKYSVTVAKANITVTVETKKHEEVPPVTDTYTVTVTGEHATATFDKVGPYKEGDVVKFSVAVDQGYDLVSVKNGSDTLTADGEGKYSVTVAKANITITVETKKHEEVPPQGAQITGYANANMVSDNNDTSFQLYLRVKQSGYQDGAAMKDDLKLVIGTKEIACEIVNDPGEGSDIYVIMFRVNKSDLAIASGESAEVTLKCADKSYTCPATNVDDNQKSVLLGSDEYTLKIEGGKLVLAYEVKSIVEKNVSFAGTAFVREGDTEKIYIAINLTNVHGYTEEELKAAKLKIDSLEFSTIPDRSNSSVLTYFITGETPTAATLAAGKYAVSLELDETSYKCPTVENGPIQQPITIGSRTYTLKTEGADAEKTLYLDIAGEAEVQKYSVTVNGNVDVAFDVAGPYEDGTEVKFTVTAKAGYTLVSVKNGETVLQAGADGKYSVTIDKADIVITAETQQQAAPAPVFTFEKGEATGSDPEIELGEKNDKGVYSVKLPENPYTAPANKYFRGWEIGGVTYYPAETYDVKDGDTVTLTAVWEDLFTEFKPDKTAIGEWGGAAGAELTVVEGMTTKATLTYSALNADGDGVTTFAGINVQIIKSATQFYFLRTDVEGAIITNNDWVSGAQWRNASGTLVAHKADDSAELWGITAYSDNTGALITADAWLAAKLAGRTEIEMTLENGTLTVKETTYTDKEGSTVYVSFAYTISGMTEHSYGAYLMAQKGTTVENATIVSHRSISENQNPTVAAPVVIGTEDNALAYTATPVWTSTVRKGEKVTLAGTMTSTGTANFHASVMFVYDTTPSFNFRVDNYINISGTDGSNVYPVSLPNGWKVTGASNEGSTVVNVGDNDPWWTGAKAVLKKADIEITYDYTGDSIIVTFKATGTDEGAGDNLGKVFLYAYTITGEFADELTIGLGGDHNYTVINSLKRTSVKEVKEEATQIEWGEQGYVKDHPNTWYYWHQNGKVTTNILDAANNSVTLTYEMGDKIWYGFQIFYKDPACKEGSWYKLSIDVKVDKDCTITINGSEVDFTANESKHVEIYYIQSDLASLSIQMGVSATDERVESATITISDVAWEDASEPQNTPIAAPTAFTVEGHTVSVTPDASNGEKGRPVYEVGFFQGEECKNTVRVKDGGEIDVTKIANGTYTLKIRQLAVSGYGASEWSSAIVENFIVANEIAEEYDMELQPQGNALDGKWYYWDEHRETKEAKYDHGTVTIRFEGNTATWYGVQLFWKNLEFATNEKYDLSMKITSTAAGKITVKGTVVELEAGVAKVVSLSNLTQGTQATIDIQMGVMEPDSKLEAATITITEIAVTKAVPVTPQPGEVKTINLTNTDFYGDMFVKLFMSTEDFAYLANATKVVVNDSYTGDNWEGGFLKDGDVCYHVRLVNTPPVAAGAYKIDWYTQDTLIATCTYTHTA